MKTIIPDRAALHALYDEAKARPMSPRRAANAGGRQSRRRRAQRLPRHEPLDLAAACRARVLRNLQRLIEARRQAGDVPEPSLVRKYLTIAAHHGYMDDLERQVAAIRRGRFDSVARNPWLARWAAHHLPEATPEHVAAIADIPLQDYSADELADILHVTYAERQRLKLWAFGACDMTRDERLDRAKADKQKKDRERAELRRRERGAKPREQSLSQTQPWVALGICRRTYERHGKSRKSLASLPTAPSAAGHKTLPATPALKAA
jgi:hypothetical protein